MLWKVMLHSFVKSLILFVVKLLITFFHCKVLVTRTFVTTSDVTLSIYLNQTVNLIKLRVGKKC